MKRSFLGYIVFLLLVTVSCTRHDNVIPKPSITISNVMVSEWNGCIKGNTVGVQSNLYYVTIYAKTNELWYSLPLNASPVTLITTDNHWICDVETLDIEHMTEIKVFLLPNRLDPPVLNGAKAIPVKVNLMATAVHNIVFIEENS